MMKSASEMKISEDEALREELSLVVVNCDDPFEEHDITELSIAAICELSESLSANEEFDEYKNRISKIVNK